MVDDTLIRTTARLHVPNGVFREWTHGANAATSGRLHAPTPWRMLTSWEACQSTSNDQGRYYDHRDFPIHLS